MKKVNFDLFNQIKKKCPLILLIANSVTINNVANVVSYIGASPIVISEVKEAEEAVKQVDAICLNLGTINEQQEKLISLILKINEKYHRPVVLDPVAAGFSEYRFQVCQKILETKQITCIRANSAETATLLGVAWQGHGIDGDMGLVSQKQLAKQAAQKFHCFVLQTGTTDYVSDGKNIFASSFTNKNFTKYVGTGDMLSAVVTSFLAIEKSSISVSTAVNLFTICGQMCSEKGAASWFKGFSDLLSSVTTEEIKEYYLERDQND